MTRSFAILAAALLAAAATTLYSASAGARLLGPGNPPLSGEIAHAERVPVLVELFTSEGCSSCPPADEVLSSLIRTQPVAGVEIIALGQHVDYWDRLGWRDPFSSPTFSNRQRDYARETFRNDDIYTPQMVVDGREAFVGSDYYHAIGAIERAAKSRAGALHVAIDLAGQPTVQVDAEQLVADAEVFVAITEANLSTEVRRGENGGRRLQHSAVVRTLEKIGTVSAGSKQSLRQGLQLDPGWRRESLQVVAFAQDSRTRRIVAAAAQPVLARP